MKKSDDGKICRKFIFAGKHTEYQIWNFEKCKTFVLQQEIS